MIRNLKETKNKLNKKKQKKLHLLYKENAAKFKYLIFRYVGNEQLAEDLMQDGFIQIMDKITQFNGSGSLEAWARRIMINTALLYLRKNKLLYSGENEYKESQIKDSYNDNQAFASEIDLDDLPEDKVCMEIIYSADFSDEDLENAINKLPDHYKVVFNLFSIDGFRHKEISEMLGINEKTSKSRLSKARKLTQHYLYQKAIEHIKTKQHAARR